MLSGVDAPQSLLAGWGRAGATRATVSRPRSPDEVAELLRSPGGSGVIPRGLGRAYGDAAQRSGGTVVDCTGLDRVVELDEAAGTVRVEAGCSLEALLRAILPRGYFVPVTPGTRHVSVGGAIAADVHGKNHHRDGSIGAHVRSMVLATPTGVRRLDAGGEDGALLDATTGGMGLTGVVTEATLELIPVETASIVVDTERAVDLDDCMARMVARDADYRYSVAWLDALATGRRLGRAVLTSGDHAPLEALEPGRRERALAYAPRAPIDLGRLPAVRVLAPSLGAALNEAWYRKAPLERTGEVQSLTAFFHPLDGVGAWNRAYGRLGFTQYQFVVPPDAGEVVRRVLEHLTRRRVPSYLAVLKRFGAAGSGHLSFPSPGWTLALDLPLGVPGLAATLDELDELVAAAGGRVYLAKDGRLRPELLAAMYPRLADWRSVRDGVDPHGVLCSDLGARLGLCGDGSGGSRR